MVTELTWGRKMRVRLLLLAVALIATAFYAIDVRAKNLDMLLSTKALASQVKVLTGIMVEQSSEMTCLQVRLDQAVAEADANLMRVTSGFHVREMELVEKCRVMTQHVTCMEVLLTETEANLTRLTSGFHVRETELVEKCRVMTEHVAGMERELDILSYNQLPDTLIETRRPGTVIQVFTDNTGWEYRASTTNAGTKSAGFEGLLTKNGEVVDGGDILVPIRPWSNIIETPWGNMRWYGHPDDRTVPWQTCGWQICGWRTVFDENKEVAQ
jgi:hypothetical protein